MNAEFDFALRELMIEFAHDSSGAGGLDGWMAGWLDELKDYCCLIVHGMVCKREFHSHSSTTTPSRPCS
jgi:hypothetical protein